MRAAGPVDTLRRRLREETATEHRRLEAALDLLRADLPRATYLRYLRVMHAAVLAHEVRVPALPGLPMHPRRKLGWLAADLAWFGQPHALPAPTAVPAPADPCSGFGAAYVMEGATLGGRVLLAHLRRIHGIDRDRGARFLHGYGEATGAMWLGFLEALAAFATTPGRQDAVVAAARATFGSILARLQPNGCTPISQACSHSANTTQASVPTATAVRSRDSGPAG